jgi:hypothetical protein
MLPTMRARAAELVDGFREGQADLVADYAIPFVQTVISAIIGLPPEDTARIQAWTDDFVLLWNPLAPVEPRVEAAKRMADYTRYLQALIDTRRADPRETCCPTSSTARTATPACRTSTCTTSSAARPGSPDSTPRATRSPPRCSSSCRTRVSPTRCEPTRPRPYCGSRRRRCAATPHTAGCSASPPATPRSVARTCLRAARCCSVRLGQPRRDHVPASRRRGAGPAQCPRPPRLRPRPARLPRRPDGPCGDPGGAGDAHPAPTRPPSSRGIRADLYRELLLPRARVTRRHLVAAWVQGRSLPRRPRCSARRRSTRRRRSMRPCSSAARRRAPRSMSRRPVRWRRLLE